MMMHIDRVLLTSAESKHFLNDFLKRVNFCDGIRRKMRTDVSFLSHVLFSDEANFPNTRNLNRHNIHYWANENSNGILLNWYIPFPGTVNAVICLDSSSSGIWWYAERRWIFDIYFADLNASKRTVPFQHSWSVNCWCGIVGDHVIGPYLCEVRLTGQVYANFLQNVLPQLMEDVPLHVRMNMWMQHDDALPHYALCSRQVMDEIFDEKWIGRGGPVAWPPRSSDLTLPDFFLWGFVKERVMAVAWRSSRTLKFLSETFLDMINSLSAIDL